MPGRACLCVCLVLAAWPAQGSEAEFRRRCEERLPAPSLVVKRAESGYSVEHHLSHRELTGMGADLLKHGKSNVLGITRAETAATVEMKLVRLENEGGTQECLSPQVVITIEYKPIRIFIGREFPADSCTYQEILQHEMRHVRTYQEHLPRIQAAVSAQLKPIFDPRILLGAPGTLERRLKTRIHEEWLPVVDREIRRVNATQALIDSAEEYDRMENVCDGEVQRILGQAT